ncbi:porin [Bdellovibrio sp. HCB274]|uniref:porin n=1 Tax=Bdellovibrio sp. HCB274 TaxID=3394361 RepID=UPI0039B39D55
MKKFLIAALATTTAMTAHAGTINFDARADYDSKTYDESNLDDSNQFYFKTIRLDYQGKVNDDLAFRLRAAYNKNGTNNAGDNSQTALEFAYLTHKMSEMFSLQIGKIGSEYGAIESQTSGADLYLTSQAYTKQGLWTPTGSPAGTNSLVGHYLSTSSLLYVTGAKLIFNITPDQNLSLVVFKTPDVSAVGAITPAATNSNAMMEGLIYKGLFMDKNLRVMASYHYGTGNPTADKYNLYSAGVSYNFGGYVLAGVDYTNSGFERDLDGAKDSIYSIIGKAAYTGWEHWVPRIEIIASEEKVESNTDATLNGTNKFMGYGAVLEYKPIADSIFRYHVAYSNTTQQMADTAMADAKVDQITIGARLNADFLK